MTSKTMAKLCAPKNYSVYNRARLFNILDQTLIAPVTWLSAPAGSGKTSLITSYCQHKSILPLWYQVDEGDSDIASFFYCLGLMAHSLKSSGNALPLLTPEYMPGLPVFTRNFFREFFSRISTPAVMVFDNYQDAVTPTLLHQVLAIAFEELPSDIKIIVISRNDPPDLFVRFRASGVVSLITWQDMQLTDEETECIAGLRISDTPLTKSEVEKLHSRAHGWAAGVVLMLEHSFTLKRLEYLDETASLENIFSYFAGELFQRADQQIQQFLLTTAFLPIISVESSRVLTSLENSQQILRDLVHRNYFIVSHLDGINSYEYHPLFREFLVAKAKGKYTEEKIKTIQNKAAQLVLEQGYFEEAARLLIDAQNWSALEELILRKSEYLIHQGRYLILATWLNALPDDCLHSNPWLLLCRGNCLLTTNPHEARLVFEKSFSIFQDMNEPTGLYLTWTKIIQTFVYAWTDFQPADRWIEVFQDLQAKYPSVTDPKLKAQVSFAFVTICTFARPQHPDLGMWVEKTANLLVYAQNNEIRAHFVNALTAYYLWMGKIDKLRMLMEVMQQLLDSEDISPLSRLNVHLALSSCLWMTGEWEKSISTASEALKTSKDKGIYILQVEILSQCAFASIAMNKFVEAKNYSDELEKAIRTHRLLETGYKHYLRGLLALFQSDPGYAEGHLLQAFTLAQQAHFVIPSALIAGKLAQALILQKKFDAALHYTNYISELADSTGSRHLRFLRDLLMSWLAIHKGEIEQAIAIFEGTDAAELRLHKCFANSLLVPQMLTCLANTALSHGLSGYAHALICHYQLMPDDNSLVLEQWPYPIKIQTLGRFRLLINEKVVTFRGKTQKKPLELLKVLIAFGGREVNGDKLNDILWPDADGDAAYDSLKTTLNRLRKLLANKIAITFIDGKISLNTQLCWVDTWAFEAMFANPARDQRQLEKGLMYYKGEFLPGDTAAPWVLSMRERLRRKYLQGVVTLGQALENQQQWENAITVYQNALQIDEMAENIYQGLMRSHLAQGQQAEAAIIYEHCCKMMRLSKNAKPSIQTENLYAELR